MIFKNNLTEYTEKEFLDFLKDIYECKQKSEAEQDIWIDHFVKIVQHPRGIGLLTWPLPEEDGSPEGITQTIKAWRLANNLPGFKTS